MSPALLTLALAGPRGDAVPLAFGWPAGLDVPVRVDVVELVSAGGEERRRCFSVSAHLRTEAVLTGLRVVFTDEVEEVPGDACARFVELRPALPAPFVVDAAGAIVNVEGDDAATRRTAEWWNRAVGYWAGTSWTRGEPRPSVGPRALPSLGWEPVPVDTRAELVEVGCRGACVGLDLVLDPGPADVTRWFTRLQATAPELGGTIGTADLLERVRIETAPTTLLPTRRLDHLEVELTMTEPAGHARRVVDQTWSFTLPPPADGRPGR